ncbi:sigma factor [Nonomuraea sp. NPDC049141]|uniref:sigma factor n=1 Tax=Nonomuraea sp. NPDC049141 TaxID=3155500 RepID=UPI0033FBFC09
MTDRVAAAVATAFREEWGQVVATLIRMTGDWDLAEECAQDAFAAALERWPRDGVPRRPGAWRLASHTGGPDARREPAGAGPGAAGVPRRSHTGSAASRTRPWAVKIR